MNKKTVTDSSHSAQNVCDDIKNRINMICEREGSASALARKAGVSDGVVRKWRSGESEPTISKLLSLAEAAGVSASWLATGKGAMIEEEGSERPAEPSSSNENLRKVAHSISESEKDSEMAELLHFIFNFMDEELLLREQLPSVEPFYFISRVYRDVMAKLPQGHSANSDEAFDLAQEIATADIKFYNQVVEIARRRGGGKEENSSPK